MDHLSFNGRPCTRHRMLWGRAVLFLLLGSAMVALAILRMWPLVGAVAIAVLGQLVALVMDRLDKATYHLHADRLVLVRGARRLELPLTSVQDANSMGSRSATGYVRSWLLEHPPQHGSIRQAERSAHGFSLAYIPFRAATATLQEPNGTRRKGHPVVLLRLLGASPMVITPNNDREFRQHLESRMARLGKEEGTLNPALRSKGL